MKLIVGNPFYKPDTLFGTLCNIIDKGENFLELGPEIKAQLLGIATVDVQFERQTSPLMVGLQRTTASLAKCYEGTLRKINYPRMKEFDSKRTAVYKIEDDDPGLRAAEETAKQDNQANDEFELPF